ncbi:uncharacterized protein TRIADDRAFT_58120 [Trichoplax adhaerens]|uniref:Expressed protein n=1 Tax=Trichoplax adhaerens TaxID=10228 RepID=B3S0X6_TRIAD|nr:expressed protein [Trichoplax adhaerens]EDV23467.1 expressed protein [Trichoplax adhaerens]|eukprot:XP_002114377.1 expressed protein [Trichoplax adhaerens]
MLCSGAAKISLFCISRQPHGDQPYIENFTEPSDGKLQYSNQKVIRYYERKVHNLKSNYWESQMKEAIENKQLCLVIGEVRRYPDNLGSTKGILGHYISFSVDVNDEVIKKLQYIGISSAGTEFIRGKLLERFEGIITGIPDVVPKENIISYLHQITSTKSSHLSTINLTNGNKIPAAGYISNKRLIFVYGYKVPQSKAWIDKAISISSYVEYNSADKVPYIDDFIEPDDGKLIFRKNVVYKYFERKVYDLMGSWEEGTQNALKHRQLFLIIDGVRRYPDNNGINKAPRGFFLTFSIIFDEVQARQIEYVNIKRTSSSIKKGINGQSIDCYSARVKGLWSPNPIPVGDVNTYLSKLIWQNLANVGYMRNNNGLTIKINKCTSVKGNLMVYGCCLKPLRHGQDVQCNLPPSPSAPVEDPATNNDKDSSVDFELTNEAPIKMQNSNTTNASHTIVESEQDVNVFHLFINILKQYGTDNEKSLGWSGKPYSC